jgi:rRNA-processing protein FCF1
MQKIILDTDFILNAVRNKIDVEKEFSRVLEQRIEIYYLDKTIEELKDKKDEKIALLLIKRFKKIKTPCNDIVDNLILALPKEYSVATQDRELKEKLKKRKIGVFTIRQNKYIIQA